MLAEFKTRSGKTKLVQHSKHPFVYRYGNKEICIEHLNPPGMNKGSMRQHVEGKAHKRDYDTGEPIVHSGFPKEILAQLELQKQEPKVKSKPDSFDELKEKLEYILDDPKAIKELLAKYGFDDRIKYDVQNKLEIQKKLQLLDKYKRFSDAINAQRN